METVLPSKHSVSMVPAVCSLSDALGILTESLTGLADEPLCFNEELHHKMWT